MEMLMKSIPNYLLLFSRVLGVAAFLSLVAAPVLAEPQLTQATNRPIRVRQNPVLVVGQNQGDLQGKDDKVIQAGIEYLNRLGGGTLRLLPGTYTLRNAIYLRSNITLEGSGETTILEKADGVVTPLVHDVDWFEYGVQVKDPAGFLPGDGIMLRASIGPGEWELVVLRATITAVRGDMLFLDRMTVKDFWPDKRATAAAIFPLLTGEHADDVVVKNIILDGCRDHNEHINGNFSGAVFIQECNRWQFENVTARNYNGDGYSFQVCDDIQFHNCRAIHNAELGFHAGSGAQRPVLRECTATGNDQGLYLCWGVSDGLAEHCAFSQNTLGISIGHRDTDNLIQGCTMERNSQAGILFRDEHSEFRGGNHNRIENCVIRDTGKDKPGVGIDIRGQTQDITIANTAFENGNAGKQETGVRIGKEAQRILLRDNTFKGCPTRVEDLRPPASQAAN